MMKKLLFLAVLFLVLGLSNAYAVPVTFNIDELYDWGRLYSYSGGVGGTYTTMNSNPAYFGVGGDTVIGHTITADTLGNQDGQEDTWGVGSIASLTSQPPGITYFQRSASEEMTFMFYGFDDAALSTPSFAGVTTIGSVGGHIQVWLDNPPDFVGADGTGNRTALDRWTGATEGALVLDLMPVVNPLTGFTLTSGFDFVNQTGNGAIYLATTGSGAWDSVFDTNTQLFGSDFRFTFTVNDNENPVVGNWVVYGDGNADGNVVPEPASMILMGIGLAGAARLRRRTA
ncbi:MAG: hypothetical protein COX96_00940 [Candidatus Omnitrophica bacterium CG_4_10_14_0_2_um_filter_44_9]|nr:MAG: hypothetical protein COX96_00940 [Candidatus Omnitrophica bacterium CG_4_10_14_0_2_um_filter_44_9]